MAKIYPELALHDVFNELFHIFSVCFGPFPAFLLLFCLSTSSITFDNILKLVNQNRLGDFAAMIMLLTVCLVNNYDQHVIVGFNFL
jgi:hypothetical protein